MSKVVIKFSSLESHKTKAPFVNPWVLLVLCLFVLILPACHKYTQPLFVAVREADFRIGPFDLPLNEDSKNTIKTFIAKSGDNRISDLVEPAAPEAYSELLELLSRDSFVGKADNLRLRSDPESIKVAYSLRKWLQNPIVFQVVDATKNRPEIISPLAISDGNYWWIFYREGDEISGFRLARLMITVDIRRIFRHY